MAQTFNCLLSFWQLSANNNGCFACKIKKNNYYKISEDRTGSTKNYLKII